MRTTLQVVVMNMIRNWGIKERDGNRKNMFMPVAQMSLKWYGRLTKNIYRVEVDHIAEGDKGQRGEGLKK